MNAAIFLDVALEDVIEPEWLHWQQPPAAAVDHDFAEIWGDQASEWPPPLKRRKGEPVALTRSQQSAEPT